MMANVPTVQAPESLPARSAVRARRRIAWARVIGKLMTHIVLIVLSFFALAPLLWAISTAFKPDSEITTSLAFLPKQPTLSHFSIVIAQTPFLRWFTNSLLVAVATTVLAIVVGSVAGYAMSRWRFWGRSVYGNTLLVVQMFPGVMLGIPMYLLLTKYGLIDTLWALLVTYLTFALAFSVWMLKGYFDNSSREIEEAALIDGASRLGILWRITL